MRPDLILIVFHIILSLVFTLFIFSGKTHLRIEHIVILWFLPFFGGVAAIIIELMNVFGQQGKIPVDMEPINLGDDILWKPLKSFHEKGDLIPLEEAILINESKVRRRFMLETLYSDPYKYLDILNIAKFNDDIETSHYATTTISKAQKDFQLSVQKFAVDVEKHPENVKMIDDYIEILGRYIKSGLLEEHLLKNLRLVYSTILDRKLHLVANDKNTLIEKLRNNIELKEYDAAFETSNWLIKEFPEDEETWVEALRVCVEGSDSVRLQEVIHEISHTDIIWTKEGRDRVNLWVKVAVK